MATIAATPVAEWHSGFRAWKWENVTESDTCEAIRAGALSDKTVQVFGTFGGGGVTMQGTLDDSDTPTFFSLEDSQGNALTISGASGKSVQQNVYKIRPGTPTGTSVSLTIILMAR